MTKQNTSPKKSTIILMYHGIADVDTDPWSIFVSPSKFRQHIEVLNTYFKTVSLNEAIDNISKNDDKSVVITFDDGYANNLIKAGPILEKCSSPATFFIISDYLASNREYWWDELEQIIFNQDFLPDNLEIEIGDKSYRWNLDNFTESRDCLSNINYPINWWENPPSAYHSLYLDLWSEIRCKNSYDQLKIINNLIDWSGVKTSCRESHRILGVNELQELANSELFEFGSHTKSHIPLSHLDYSEILTEVSDSKTSIEEIIRKPVKSLSYPFGDYDDRAVNIVKNMDYQCALTTQEGVYTSVSDMYTLPRIQVCDWDGEMFLKVIQNMFQSA